MGLEFEVFKPGISIGYFKGEKPVVVKFTDLEVLRSDDYHMTGFDDLFDYCVKGLNLDFKSGVFEMNRSGDSVNPYSNELSSILFKARGEDDLVKLDYQRSISESVLLFDALDDERMSLSDCVELIQSRIPTREEFNLFLPNREFKFINGYDRRNGVSEVRLVKQFYDIILDEFFVEEVDYKMLNKSVEEGIKKVKFLIHNYSQH